MTTLVRQESRRLLAASVSGRRRQVAGLAAWSLVQAVPAFASGRLLALAIDEGFLAGRTATGFGWLAGLAAAVLVGAWGTRQAYLRLAALVEPFRDELVERVVAGVLRSPRAAAGPEPSGAAGVAQLTQHVEILREAYAGVLMTVQGFAVTALSALIGLSGLLPAAMLLVVPPVALGLAIFAAALGPMAARRRASIQADEAMAESTATMAAGLRDVVACGAEPTVAAMVGGPIDAQADATRALARSTAVGTAAVAAGGWLPVVLLLMAGPWLVRNGASTGELLGAMTYVLYGIHPALQTLVRELAGSGLWLFVALDRVVEAAAQVPAPVPDATPGPSPQSFDLRLQDISFRYGASPEPVVDGLDLEVPEGDHLAVVGPSGVGKSTLAGLMAGLLRPDAGQVSLGGRDAAGMGPADLARVRVLIPQEAYVFAGTVRENLAYLRDDATDADLDQAVLALGAAPLVARLGGYEAALDVGSLSGGERQLLTLVRSWLSPAPVVILDEATCHLDPAAEAQVEAAFARRPGTLVVVAHRISSAHRARRVLVMDGDRVTVGPHQEVLAASPLYRDLVGHWG
jgi:ABC-type multidrug transport system fused ATPase/permease subunit